MENSDGNSNSGSKGKPQVAHGDDSVADCCESVASKKQPTQSSEGSSSVELKPSFRQTATPAEIKAHEAAILHASHRFNAGKMMPIFKMDERGMYLDEYLSTDARECFEDPLTAATLKVDGECSCLVRQRTAGAPPPVLHGTEGDGEVDGTADGSCTHASVSREKVCYEWVFCKRQDNFKGDGERIPLPDGQEPSSHGTHNYTLVPVDKAFTTGKGKRKSLVGEDTYAAISQGIALGLLPDPNAPGCPDHITVEWVGQKHQKNVDNCPAHHGIAVHGTVAVDYPREVQELKEMAKNCSIEGIVLVHRRTGQRFKIRFDRFKPSQFWRNARAKTVTNATTSLKPTVITRHGIVDYGAKS